MNEKEYDKVRQEYCLKYDAAKKAFESAFRLHTKQLTEKSHAKVAKTNREHYEALRAFDQACTYYNREYGFAGGFLK
jgi:hypothetical protein